MPRSLACNREMRRTSRRSGRSRAAQPSPRPSPKAEGELQTAPSAEGELQRELERIARLREEGRNAEADKALEEFRRANPGYRIPDAMWERVRAR